jgi:hypothetical protein
VALLTTSLGPVFAQAGPGADLVKSYFDMLDFCRTQAWGHPSSTPAAERQRVTIMLQEHWGELDAQTQAGILALPGVWAQLQKNWQTAGEADRTRQRALWRDQLLMPGNLYPPPPNPQQFSAEGNVVRFEYPGDWSGGMTEIEGTPFLFIGPGGSQANWQQVFDAPNAPPGALFALAEIPAEMQDATYAEGARHLARLLMPGGAHLREVQMQPIGEVGAILTVAGKFPGQEEEKFFWIGVTRFDDGRIIAGRLGGPVSQAATLLPGFTWMLSTLEVKPPAAAGGGGGVAGAWETAYSRVGVAITKNIWAPSGN